MLPASARLVQSRIEGRTLAPLDTIDVINIDSGNDGVLFFHTLSAQSGNMNFLEGCCQYLTSQIAQQTIINQTIN